jgi:hypothetical protein
MKFPQRVYISGFGDGYGTGYTNEVLVILKSKDDYPVLQKYANVYHIKDIKSRIFSELKYKLTLPHNSQKDALDTANELYETMFFVYAVPNLIHIRPFATSDTYFNNLWGLKSSS